MKVVADLSLTATALAPLAPPAWYAPWASPITGTSPALVLDFVAGSYGAGGAEGTLGSVLAFARGTEGSVVDAAGALVSAPPDTARIDHDPATLAPLGLLLETGRTNLISGSAAPVDQTVDVAGVPHVLSFYGTGSVTLSGAYAGTVTGGGAYPVRTVLPFTPAAGALSLAFTGEVTAAQLEEGEAASSYIPAATAPVTRGEDIASVPLGEWFNPSGGTLVFSGALAGAQANDRIVELDDGTTSSRLSLLWNTVLDRPQFQAWDGGALQAAVAPGGNAIGLGNHFRAAVAFSASGEFAVSVNGSAVAVASGGVVPAGLTTLRLGRSAWGAQGLMVAESLTCYPARLPDDELQALSA